MERVASTLVFREKNVCCEFFIQALCEDHSGAAVPNVEQVSAAVPLASKSNEVKL